MQYSVLKPPKYDVEIFYAYKCRNCKQVVKTNDLTWGFYCSHCGEWVPTWSYKRKKIKTKHILTEEEKKLC